MLERKAARLGGALAVDPSGRHVLVGSSAEPIVFLVPIGGGEPRRMPGFQEWTGEGLGSLDFSPAGSLAAAVAYNAKLIRIWNFESGDVRVLETVVANEHCGRDVKDNGTVSDLRFLPGGRILTVGAEGIRVWDLEGRSSREIRPCTPQGVWSYLATDRKGGRFLVADVNLDANVSSLAYYDLETATERKITAHGNGVSAVALDPTGTIAVTGSFDGIVRIGLVDGGEPHLLFGHTREISSIAVSPDGRWIASGSQDGTIRLWPMPDLSKPPLHTLPYRELLAKLRELTNLRVVPDPGSATGYKLEIGPFPGWARVPEW